MKKNLMISILTAVMSVSMAAPVMAGHIYAGDGVEKTISYDENGGRVITLVFDPANMPDYMKPMAIRQAEAKTENRELLNEGKEKALSAVPKEKQESVKTESVKIEPQKLKAPPEIGRTLGYIFNEETQRFTENYRAGNIGQCTWYAKGRFREVHGIEMPYMGRAKEWIDTAYKTEGLAVITDLTDVPDQAVAVFAPTINVQESPGHVVFIEYVERDKDGTPVTIYYTEANGNNDPTKGKYDASFDGTVRSRNLKEFQDPYGLKLLGYIVPK